MAGKFIKGALVEFMQTFLVPVPNVIVFQFNPETMTHTWTQPAPDPSGANQGEQSNPLAVKGVPGESFSFTLALDATDLIASGGATEAGIASASGVYTRLAALEMLQYPVPAPPTAGLTGTVSSAIKANGISPRRVAEHYARNDRSQGNAADGAVRLGRRPHLTGARDQPDDYRETVRRRS